MLAGVPSIAVGIYAYALLVEPFRHFSAFSASFAFAVLIIPLVIRATEAAIALVPRELREAATALGAPESEVVLKILVVSAHTGIVTGLLLSLARVTGETAPLLFTAFGSQYWELNPAQPMAELSLQIFTYAISPYADWHAQAWGGALLSYPGGVRAQRAGAAIGLARARRAPRGHGLRCQPYAPRPSAADDLLSQT